MSQSQLDPGQIVKHAYIDASESIKVTSIGGSLITVPFDYLALSYTGANLTQVVYYTGGSGGTIVGTLTLAYSGSNLISVTKT